MCGRHTENPRYLIDLELPRFQKLRLFREMEMACISCPSSKTATLFALWLPPKVDCQLSPLPFGRVFQRPRMLQHAARLCAVGEELRPVFLAGNRHPDSVLCHGNGE